MNAITASRIACWFAFAFCAVPLLGILAPRGMAFLPGLSALAGFFICWRYYKIIPPFSTKAIGWVSVLTLLIAVGSLWGINPDMVWERTVKIFPLLFFGIALIAVLKYAPQDAIYRIQKFYPYFIIISGLICILELMTKGFFYSFFHDVMEKINEDSVSFLNRSVIIFNVTAIAVFFMKVPKTFKYLTGLCMIATLLLTESQSVQLAVGVSVLAALLPAQSKKLCFILALVTCLSILGAPWIAQWLFHDVASWLYQYAWFREGYAADRTEIWDFVARRALERPILGHGIEATRQITDFDIQGVYFKNKTVLHPHNFALQIWIEFGVVGTVFFSAFISYVFYRIWRLGRYSRMAGRFAMAIFAACLSMAMTSYGLWQGWWIGLFTFMFGLCAVITRLCEPRMCANKKLALDSNSGDTVIH